MSDRVPTRFVTTLLKMVDTRGYDFSHILADAGLEFDHTDPDHPGYRAEISAMQYSRVYQHVLNLLQDETFGVTGSELVAPGAFRMMCYCIISCDNLGQAIRRASEFYRTFFDERKHCASQGLCPLTTLHRVPTKEFHHEGFRCIGVNRPIGNEEGPGPRMEKGPTDTRNGPPTVGILDRGVAGGQHDPVGVELEPEDLGCAQQPVLRARGQE